MDHYTISDAIVIYCITVNVAKATRNLLSTMTRHTTYQGKPRIAMREAVVQKKKITREKNSV